MDLRHTPADDRLTRDANSALACLGVRQAGGTPELPTD